MVPPLLRHGQRITAMIAWKPPSATNQANLEAAAAINIATESADMSGNDALAQADQHCCCCCCYKYGHPDRGQCNNKYLKMNALGHIQLFNRKVRTKSGLRRQRRGHKHDEVAPENN